MHFAMHAFSNHVQVLHNVTPIDLLVQSAVLFSLTGWLSKCLYKVRCRYIPLLWRGGRRSLTGWLSKCLYKVRCRYIPLLRRGGRRSLTGWLCCICTIYSFIQFSRRYPLIFSSKKSLILFLFVAKLENCRPQTSVKRARTLRLMVS